MRSRLIITCARCGRRRQHSARGLCSGCASALRERGTIDEGYPRATRRAADVTEDVAELVAARETPERIAARLGMTAEAIARALYRAGRGDLARPFQRVARLARPIRDNHPWTPARAAAQRRRRAAGRAS